MRKIIILLSCLFTLCGCYDYRELNDMSIVSAIGIDYKDNKYIVSLEITKSSKDGSSTEIETKVVTGKDKNLAEAFVKAKNMSDKYVYMEHVELLILGKKLSYTGIDKVIDYIIRDTTISNNYFAIIAENPEEILNVKLENQSMSELIVNTVDYYLDKTNTDDVDIIASNIMNNRKDIAIPYITLKENQIEFKNVAYFDKAKLVGFIDTKMYSFLELDSVNISFNNQDNTIDIYKKKIDFEVKKNEILISISAYGKIKEIDENINLQKAKSYKELEKLINDVVKKETEEFLNKTLKDKCDLLGLGDKYYKKYKKNMNDIKYKIKVDVTVNRNGTIYGVLNDN